MSTKIIQQMNIAHLFENRKPRARHLAIVVNSLPLGEIQDAKGPVISCIVCWPNHWFGDWEEEPSVRRSEKALFDHVLYATMSKWRKVYNSRRETYTFHPFFDRPRTVSSEL